MCVLSIKVPIWKTSGNLFNYPRIFYLFPFFKPCKRLSLLQGFPQQLVQLNYFTSALCVVRSILSTLLAYWISSSLIMFESLAVEALQRIWKVFFHADRYVSNFKSRWLVWCVESHDIGLCVYYLTILSGGISLDVWYLLNFLVF